MLARTFKIAWFNRGRYLLTLVAIALSVAFIVATLILTLSVQNVSEPLRVAYADVDAKIGGIQVAESEGPGGVLTARVDSSMLAALEAAGLEAYGRTDPYAQILDAEGNPGGQTRALSNIAEPWLGDSALNGYTIHEGRGPEGPHEAMLDASTASDANLEVGTRITIVTAFGVQELELVGLAYFGGQDSVPYQSTVLLAEDHELFTDEVGYSAILVAGEGSSEEVTAQVRDLLGQQPVQVITGAAYVDELTAALDMFLSFFVVFLTAFAVIAVIVGAVIVANTFTVSVAQRTQELALFRLIGSTRRQLMIQVVIEATALAVVGSALGLVLGLFGSGLLNLALEWAGLAIERTDTVSPIAIVAGIAIGLIVTVFSSVRPAWKTSATPPIEALRTIDEEIVSSSNHRLVIGLAIMAIASGLTSVGMTRFDTLITGSGLGVLLLALIVLAPFVIKAVAWAMRPVLGLFGPPGLIASRNLARNAARTSAASLALMIGVALVAFFTLLANTIQEFSTGGADDYLSADYVVQGVGDMAEPVLSPELVDTLAKAPGVDSVAAVVPVRVSPSGRDLAEELTIGVTDMAALARMVDFAPIGQTALSISGTEVVVGQGLADQTGIREGDRLTVESEFGPIDITVAAIVENTLPGGFADVNILMDRSSGLVGATEPATFVYLGAPSLSETELDQLVDLPTVDVLTRSAFLDGLNSALASFIGLIYALLGVAVIIALVGIANTVSLAISERAGEIGAVRAAGANRRQVFFSLLAEFSLLALVGVAVGMALALVAAFGLGRAISEGEISSVSVSIPAGVLIVGLGLASGALAAVWPSRNAAMRDILTVLRAE